MRKIRGFLKLLIEATKRKVNYVIGRSFKGIYA